MQRILRSVSIVFAVVVVAPPLRMLIQTLRGSAEASLQVWLLCAQAVVIWLILAVLAFAVAKVLDSLETLIGRLDRAEARSPTDPSD